MDKRKEPKMAPLTSRWKANPDSFVEVPKAEFDNCARAGSFTEGPFVAGPTEFMREFGPYSPERWAFGLLLDGRYVKTET